MFSNMFRISSRLTGGRLQINLLSTCQLLNVTNQLPEQSCSEFNEKNFSNVEKGILDGPKKYKKKPLWYYDNKGIRARKLNQYIRKCQEDTETATEDVLHFKRIFDCLIQYGLTEKEIQKMIGSKPRLLELSRKSLRKRLDEFELLGLPKDTVKKSILQTPGLLLLDIKEVSLQDRLNILQGLPLTPRLNQERSLYLVQRCPSLLYLTDRDSLIDKLKVVEDAGMHPQQLFTLIMKHPSILTYKKESIEKKINYLVNELNGRLSLISRFPRYLTSSLERIKERHVYLKKEMFMTKRTQVSENKLRSIVLTNDSDFVYRITNTKMKNYRKFQKEYIDGKYENIDEELDERLFHQSTGDDSDDEDEEDLYEDVLSLEKELNYNGNER